MTSGSDMPRGLHAKKARNARCKRLEIEGKRKTIVRRGKCLSKKARFCVKESLELEKGSGSGSGKTVELKNEVGFEYGSVSLIGRRRVMEDAIMVAPGLVAGEFDFFAVYDGHGGSKVANACRERLHHLLEKEVESKKMHLVGDNGEQTAAIHWEEVMMTCFAKMDEEIMTKSGEEVAEMTARTVGSTAVVVVVGKEELVVASCGDSRAVLCRGGVAMPLSHDHKPDRPDETERVEAAGGRIINWNGCRVLGVLATSRSIGDHYLRPYVISEPEVTRNRLTESDDFLIVATDGLWDVISNDFACKVVKQCLDGHIRRKIPEGSSATEAVAILAELAIAKGSTDNISVIVVMLKKSSMKY